MSAGVGGCDKVTSWGERGYKEKDLCDPLEMEAANNEVCQGVLLTARNETKLLIGRVLKTPQTI